MLGALDGGVVFYAWEPTRACRETTRATALTITAAERTTLGYIGSPAPRGNHVLANCPESVS